MFEERKNRALEEIPAAERKTPVLELGQVVATPGAIGALEDSGELGKVYLRRHHCGDWGELDPEDWSANDRSLREGTRILSAYGLASGERLWIITEWDRSITTLLLPSEY